MVTWKWLVGTLIALLFAVGGYAFNLGDARILTQQTAVAILQDDVTKLDVRIAQEEVRTIVQYREIDKRLERIEASIARIEEQIKNLRRF